MDLQTIRKEWVLHPTDFTAETSAWDSTAEEYVYEEKNNFEDDPFLKFVAEKVALTKDMRTLDVGCGAGAYSVAMAAKVGQADGVDLSPKSVEVAKAKLDGHATLLVGDVESIPLEDASMDVVLNMHSFHHYPRPIHALSEIKRILKDDGVLYFVENDFRHLNRIRANLMLTLMNHKKGDVKKYSSRQLQKMLLAAGLKPLLVERIAKHSVLFVCEKRYV